MRKRSRRQYYMIPLAALLATAAVHHHLIDKMLNVGFLGIDHDGDIMFKGGFTQPFNPGPEFISFFHHLPVGNDRSLT